MEQWPAPGRNGEAEGPDTQDEQLAVASTRPLVIDRLAEHLNNRLAQRRSAVFGAKLQADTSVAWSRWVSLSPAVPQGQPTVLRAYALLHQGPGKDDGMEH